MGVGVGLCWQVSRGAPIKSKGVFDVALPWQSVNIHFAFRLRANKYVAHVTLQADCKAIMKDVAVRL